MQKPLKKFYFLLAGLSILLSLGGTLWLKSILYPFQLIEKSNATMILNGRINYYKDLDHDGVGERIVFFSDKSTKLHNLKIYKQPTLNTGSIIDQYNFYNSITFREIFYQDITGDSTMELIVFSKNDSCLYLSIIDIKENRYLYKERLLFRAPAHNPYTFWDVDILGATFSDINSDGTKDMIFTLHSGHSKSPRGIFAFDLKNWKILHRFLYNAGSSGILTYDINGDGVNEFITCHAATDNIRSTDNYTDQKSWLMAFDRNLNLVFKPLVLGDRFATARVLPFRYHNQNNVLTFIYNKSPDSILLINGEGQIIQEWTFDFFPYLVIQNPAFDNNFALIIGRIKENIVFIDSTFHFRKQPVFSDNRAIDFFDIKDLDRDGHPEFLGYCKNGIYIKSEDMRNLAFFPWEHKFVKSFSCYYEQNKKIPYLAVNTNDLGYTLVYQPNPLYPYISLLFFVFSSLLFTIFYLSHLGFNQIRIYTSYLLFSLRGSDNAIILVNHVGKIISFNAKVQDMLKVSIKSKEHFKQALASRPQISDIIDKALKEGLQFKREYSFEEAESSFIGEVTVTPFKSYFKFINAILVEIKDSTRQVMLERQQNWQRNVRQMVHDIKNPLAGIQLKLQTLYLKLIDSQPSLPNDIKEEFEQAYSELKRIRNISKNFLKFSDLEIIQPERISLEAIYSSCVEHFKIFKTPALSLKLYIDDNLPQEVYWDRRQIELLIHIIIENAIDALNGKGLIEVSIKPSAEILSIEEPYIEFRISDNGPGIPDIYHSKIFEPHFSTKKEGSGMGLVFAKQIVKQHGGHIHFYSTKDSGTVFVITLPDKISAIKK